MSRNDKKWQKFTSWQSYVFYQKKRTNNGQKVVEPILELENIDQSRKKAVVAHSVQF